jgi:hypothetical protein
VLCKHLLAVSRSLKGPEGNLEISLHFPSQRTNPFRQADFSKVIQSRYEPLLAGSAKLAKFGGIGASADFERRRDPRLGWPRSAQDTVERRESCLSHFASLSFLHVQAGAISELQGTSVFGMPSNGLPNIISRETERLARCHATKDDMDIRVVRVPVNHPAHSWRWRAMPRVNVRLGEELYDRLAWAAKGRGYGISRLVRDVLAAGLAEERISATLDRFAKDIRRLHTADQALYAAFDTFVRLFLTCIPDPPSDCLTAAKVQGHHRYNNYLENVARNMNGDARAALGELTNRG